jgi:hypothetical protein
MRLIEFEGIEFVEDLANYTDVELDGMVDRISKRTPANAHLQMGLARMKALKALKAITHWVRKKFQEGVTCTLHELMSQWIAELIIETNAELGHKESDFKLYYSESSRATNYKNWIKKVENYLDSRTGKSGVPLSYVIHPVNVTPVEATDKYTRAKWATSFEAKQYCNDNREVYHLFKDLVTKTQNTG